MSTAFMYIYMSTAFIYIYRDNHKGSLTKRQPPREKALWLSLYIYIKAVLIYIYIKAVLIYIYIKAVLTKRQPLGEEGG